MQSRLQLVGTSARLTGVQPSTGPPCLLLELELFGTVIPVRDLLGKPILDRGAGPVDVTDATGSHLVYVFGDDVRNCVAERPLFEIPRDPCALRTREQLLDARFIHSERTIIKIRRVVQVARVALGLDL